jgi:hypothetical protein
MRFSCEGLKGSSSRDLKIHRAGRSAGLIKEMQR